jgi:predicted transcriptional regulator
MPKPVKPKRTSLSVSLPPELAAKLQSEAYDRMLNPSLLIEHALKAYLPTLPPLNGNEPG